jgi:hypothetical protein
VRNILCFSSEGALVPWSQRIARAGGWDHKRLRYFRHTPRLLPSIESLFPLQEPHLKTLPVFQDEINIRALKTCCQDISLKIFF